MNWEVKNLSAVLEDLEVTHESEKMAEKIWVKLF